MPQQQCDALAVIAGLDPAIHRARTRQKRWMPGSSPGMTEVPRPTRRRREGGASSGDGRLYILASGPGGTLYVGVTSDLVRRVFQHRTGAVPGFTKRYGVTSLVYFERHETIVAAIQREKNIKHWPREWKIDLIVSMNPDWRDLFDEIAE